MSRAIVVFENEGKILFLPDGQRVHPTWDKVSIRYSADLSKIEVVDMVSVPPRVVGSIYNLRLINALINAKSFYAGWLNDLGQIDQMPITVDFGSLLP